METVEDPPRRSARTRRSGTGHRYGLFLWGLGVLVAASALVALGVVPPGVPFAVLVGLLAVGSDVPPVVEFLLDAPASDGGTGTVEEFTPATGAGQRTRIR
jgi:hypothetical protein